jgi:drug/metabolite transporter (DMT)-like permease
VADPRLLVAGLLLVDSLHFIFARLLLPLMPPAAGAMYMMVLGTAEIALLMRGRIDWRAFWRHRGLFIALGLLVGVNTNMGFAAMRYIDPGTASVLSLTSIPLGVALGVAWLGERLSATELLGASIAFLGVLAISLQPGEYLRWGSAMIVAAAFLYAAHSAVAKRHGGDVPFGEFLFFRAAAVAGVLVMLVLAQGELMWPPALAWGWLLVAATVNVVISRGLFYLALRQLEMSFLTIILTLTPVVTWLWSILLFGGRPGRIELLGGAATLIGVLIVTSSRAGLLGLRRVPRGAR